MKKESAQHTCLCSSRVSHIIVNFKILITIPVPAGAYICSLRLNSNYNSIMHHNYCYGPDSHSIYMITINGVDTYMLSHMPILYVVKVV